MNEEPYPIPTAPQKMKVTPEMAADWLENRNAQAQRRLSEHIASKYAKIMAAGRWPLTHQAIGFDYDGWLIDGQHRLRAVVISGVAIEMWVIPDCDPATFSVLDNGHKRQAGQLIKHPGAKTIAAAARILAVVAEHTQAATNTQGGVYDGSLPTDLIVETAGRWPELATYAMPVDACYRNAKINKPMHLAILAMAARTKYAERIGSWLDGIEHGAALEGGDPRLLLRNRYIKDAPLLNGGSSRNLSYNLIVKAWNAHARHQTLGVLKILDSEGVINVVTR